MRYLGLIALALSLPYLTDVAADWSFKRAQADHEQGYTAHDIEGINLLLTMSDKERAARLSPMTQAERNAAVKYLFGENEK